MNLKETNEKDLKAIAYDLVIEIQRLNNNLVTIQNELQARQQQKQNEFAQAKKKETKKVSS
jgi:hypothetical protein